MAARFEGGRIGKQSDNLIPENYTEASLSSEVNKLDKNEYNLKLEEIQKFADQGNYAEAVREADQIDWRRVRNVRTLCLISEIYEAEGRFDDSKAILVRAYRRSPVGRTVLYRLVEVCIKLKQFDEAIEYYAEYIQAAPHDNNKYILKYKIYRGRGSSLDEQIAILKEYLDQEYNEKYAYELAERYREADRIRECLTTCDDLVLWFHHGKYVYKALELKQRYAQLTPKQQEIYDHRFDEADEDVIGQEMQIVGEENATLAETIAQDTADDIARELTLAAENGELELPGEETVKSEMTQVLPTLPTGTEAETEQAQEDAARESGLFETRVLGDLPLKEELAKTRILGDLPLKEELARTRVLEDPRKAAGESRLLKNLGRAVGDVVARVQAEEDTDAAKDLNELLSESRTDADTLEGAEEVMEAEGSADADSELPEDTDAQWSQEASEEETEEEKAGFSLRDPQTDKVSQASITGMPLPEYESADALREEVAKSMRSITSGVGIRDTVDPREEAIDEVIEVSKKDQENEDANQVKMPSGLKIPKMQTRREANQLSIDDILLSMGDRGHAVREVVSHAGSRPVKQPEGVLSAVDEALLNMGREEAGLFDTYPDRVIETEPVKREDAVENTEAEAVAEESTETGMDAAGELTGEAEAEADREVEAEEAAANEAEAEAEGAGAVSTEEVVGETAASEVAAAEPAQEDTEDDVRIAPPVGAHAGEKKESSQPEEMTMKDIIRAETRKLPTEEVTQRLEEQEEAPVYVKPAYRHLFDGFLELPNVEQQIGYAIDKALAKGGDRTSRTGNILIFGGHGCGKTTIATGIAKTIAQEQGRAAVRMARIYATDLNRKDIAATLAKISGGVLIVEEAGDLEDGIADQITTAMEFRTDGLIVIFEDEQRYLHELLMRHPRLTMKFTSQIYIPEFYTEDLVRFGQLYALEQDCTLSEAGEAALAAKLERRMDETDEPISISVVLDIMDAAIKRAHKFSRKVFGGKKRFDQDGHVYLQEKDFK